jgi:arginase
VRRLGAEKAAQTAVNHLLRDELAGFWIHLDADVLDDAVMPAVDYRLPGGLSFEELAEVLSTAFHSGFTVGLDVTIYNPKLDPTRSAARGLIDALVKSLSA